MSAPLIKICGMMDSGIAREVSSLPIDWFGFVFAPSRRRITPKKAKEIMDAVRKAGGRQKFAGVFVNPSLEQLREVLDEAKLDAVQLHGSETPDFVRALRKDYPGAFVWKAAGIRSGADPRETAAQLKAYGGLIDALLLDTYDPHVGGGTGRTFCWEAIPYYAQWTLSEGIPLFVAGGLTAENVGELIASYAPDGVDVSSGVESGGKKDAAKIIEFVRKVKRS